MKQGFPPDTPPVSAADSSVESAVPEAWDVRRKFIRIVELREDGMVAFEFAIGDPALYVCYRR